MADTVRAPDVVVQVGGDAGTVPYVIHDPNDLGFEERSGAVEVADGRAVIRSDLFPPHRKVDVTVGAGDEARTFTVLVEPKP